jgi:hypothetical protein
MKFERVIGLGLSRLGPALASKAQGFRGETSKTVQLDRRRLRQTRQEEAQAG